MSNSTAAADGTAVDIVCLKLRIGNVHLPKGWAPETVTVGSATVPLQRALIEHKLS